MNVRRHSLTLLITGGLATSLGACKGDDGGDDGADASGTETDPGTTSASTTMSTTDPSETMTTVDPSETDPTEDPTVDPTVDPDSTGEPSDLIAFRFTSLYIRDPHLVVNVPLVGCQDGTDMMIELPLNMEPVDSVNQQFNDSINNDDPETPDGSLDLSLLLLFRPLDQGGAGAVDFANGSCLVPASNTVCDLLAGTDLYSTDYTTLASGSCQVPEAADLSSEGYSPPPGTTDGPCFTAGPASVVIQTSFAALPLDNATIAAQFVGDPSEELIQGTIRGFITVANAEAIMLPPPISTAAQTLAAALPGHPDCCADYDDRDENMTGWWFYADFTAETVPWNGA